MNAIETEKNQADAADRELPAAAVRPVALTVNGSEKQLHLEPRATLLDTLRDHFGLTGTKKGCDHGQCGACSVLVDGRRTNACLTLAIMHEGAEIATVEGLAKDGELHPVQKAFLDHDAFQCGFCTSGQIMSAVGLLNEPWDQDDASLREAMSGNLCRCAAYRNIFAAVRELKDAAKLGESRQ